MKTKKILSLILSLAMICTMFTAFTVTASAENTPVTATTTIPAPTYTVTIPETVSFGEQKQALEKYKALSTDQFGNAILVSKDLTVSATGVANLFNDLEDSKADYINVTATFDGTLKGTNSTANTVPYTLSQNSTTLANGAKIATFYNDVDLASKGKTNSATATITINRTDIKNADSYQGTMTFTIAVANR
ncbi:MAG: hypothetical protein RR263_03740 [Oscillospiraceae bacterium]